MVDQAIILADHPDGRSPMRGDVFKGFIDMGDYRGAISRLNGRGALTRRQMLALRRQGYVPAVAGGSDQAAVPSGVVAMLPFTSSAHEHTEPAFVRTVTPTTAEQTLDPIGIPANGWLRHVFLQVDASGGTLGTGVANADYPFSLFSSALMQEINGGNIFGTLSGFETFLANLIGGYAFKQDAREMPAYVGTAPNPVFTLRVPAEVSQRDGLGSLANQNASALFQLLLSVGALASQYSTVGTVAPGPHVIRGWLEAWTLPAPQDSRGRPQSQQPPLVGSGQYWSKRTKATLVGDNTVEFTRLGNMLRNIVLVARDATGVRADNVFPDPVFFNWDGFALQSKVSQRWMKQYAWEKILTSQAALAGVFVLPFSHGGLAGGKMGNDTPDLWLGTTQASRLEISGTSAAAGSVAVLTNEVAPIEANPAAQFQYPNQTGQLASPAGIQQAPR